MQHPPEAQGAYSICEQKGSYKSPERKVWEVNSIFYQTLLTFFSLGFSHNQILKPDPTWTPLLHKIMTKRAFLVFLTYSPEERLIPKFQHRFLEMGRHQVPFSLHQFVLISPQMQKPTQKMLSHVQKEIASIHQCQCKSRQCW